MLIRESTGSLGPAEREGGTTRRPSINHWQGLRDFSDVQVMTTGVSLAGKVTDEHDKPITGAEVGWLESERAKHLPRRDAGNVHQGRWPFPVSARSARHADYPGQGEGLRT